ncbi:MAG: VWA domain-containing protein, partial [Nannocystaceae bacterium]
MSTKKSSPTRLPLAMLLLGVAAAVGINRWIGDPGPALFELPEAVARAISSGDDRTLVLSQPHILWLLPVALLPYLLVTARRSLVDVPGVQVAAQLLIRLAVLVALALALALPNLESPIRGKTVVMAIDVSASIDDAQFQRANELVAQAREWTAKEDEQGLDREDRTRLRVITYAEDAKIIDPGVGLQTEGDTAEDNQGQPLKRHTRALASNHAAALHLAQALLDPDTEGRIVMVSDGGGSLAERGDLAAAARELKARGIDVHTRSFPASVRGDVMVAGVHLPEELRVSQTFDVVVDLVASEAMTLTLQLDKNGQPNPLAPTKSVELRAGRTQLKLPARVSEPGPVVFTARLDTTDLTPAQNRSPLNDRAAVVGDVRGRPRVLLADSSDKTNALARALRADHLHVEIVPPSELPTKAEDLRPYDLVVFSDVAAGAVSPNQRAAVVSHVSDGGGGFIMVGGEKSFGVGGWAGTSIEGILPVKFEGERQREQPTLALLLVIDKSGSMSSEDRLDLVKEAARATASTLDPSDELGVIAFDSRPYVLVRLQPAKNRLRIAGNIRRLSAGGGTNAVPALRESYLQLAGSRALVKHVILLSDGQSPESGLSSLLGDMRDADITVSTVGVGAGAGKDFLARVARSGRGRYYFSQDGTDVPRIFSRETREVTRNAVVERRLYPRVAKPVQALRGIDFGRAPGLLGIIPTKPKKLSEVLLRTHLGDPLLVRGRRGLGRTVAFTSDAKPRWATHWVSWTGFAKLWSQVARDTLRQGAGRVGGATIEVA